jgi:hypothetical protein
MDQQVLVLLLLQFVDQLHVLVGHLLHVIEALSARRLLRSCGP